MEPFVDIHTHRLQPEALTLPAAGIHPWEAGRCTQLLPLPLPDGCRAVGEIGLDYACGVDRARQERLFRAQLGLAEERSLAVILHCVRAFEAVMRILKEYRLPAVIFHGFIGSPQQARQALARGCFLSFGERSLRSPRTVEALKEVPDEQLFAETDESDLPIAELYGRIAALRGCTVGELRRQILRNYETLLKRL